MLKTTSYVSMQEFIFTDQHAHKHICIMHVCTHVYACMKTHIYTHKNTNSQEPIFANNIQLDNFKNISHTKKMNVN